MRRRTAIATLIAGLTTTHPVMARMVGTWAKAWAPPPMLTVSQWADANRRLPAESAAEPGRWDTSRTPYLRAIMDAVNDPDVHIVVVKSSSQVGKTEALINIMGYFIDSDPGPMLLVYPTVETAEDFSKERLAPTIRDTPCLYAKVSEAKSRDQNNTLRKKLFPGGHLTLVGANAPSGLSSKPIKLVLFDEVDRFPASAGTEGDPVNLAIKRTTTFWNRKIVMVSTPGLATTSRIEKAWQESDQRRYFVLCPHCGESIRFVWAGVVWPKGRPEEAVYVCQECGVQITDADKVQMLDSGQWRPTWQETEEKRNPKPGVVGFHLNEMYAPWANTSFAQIAMNHVEAARKGAEALQVWVNTSLGEPWEEEGEKVDWQVLYTRREEWNDAVPQRAAVLTAGVDVQKDRLELEVVGWGIDHETWSVDYRVLFGDTAQSDVWEQLDRALLSTYEHAGGATLTIAAAGVDSGYRTDEVHKFCLERWARCIYALKGEAGAGRPLIVRPAKPKRGKCPLFRVGSDTAKDLLYARLSIQRGPDEDPTAPRPGYCHFPMARTEEYFKQLTAEKQVTKYSKGHGTRVWIKESGARNEALDCRVYAMAAFAVLNPDVAGIVASLSQSKKPKPPVVAGRRIRGRMTL